MEGEPLTKPSPLANTVSVLIPTSPFSILLLCLLCLIYWYHITFICIHCKVMHCSNMSILHLLLCTVLQIPPEVPLPPTLFFSKYSLSLLPVGIGRVLTERSERKWKEQSCYYLLIRDIIWLRGPCKKESKVFMLYKLADSSDELGNWTRNSDNSELTSTNPKSIPPDKAK